MMFSFLSAAAAVLLSLSHPDGVYQKGDTVRVYATEGEKVTLVHSEVASESPYNGSFKYEDTSIGWVVAPEEFTQAVPRPKDFRRWWRSQIKTMRTEKMVPVLVEVEEVNDPGIICYKLEINCVGGNPVRGYIAMPRGAEAGSLPIVMQFHAAGVTGKWCRCTTGETVQKAKWGNGAICVNINAFGMENDREEDYYVQLQNGAYNNYSTIPYASREEYFFKNMYLRAVRALDFACSLPQWDGRRVLAYGESQGGAQAIALSGLDKRVSAVLGVVPAGCNSAGSAVTGGKDSWPFIYRNYADKAIGRQIMSYFDGCNFLADTKAVICVEIGLLDDTCRPAGIYAAINANRSANPKGKITVLTSPWRYHHNPDARYGEEWRKNVVSVRNQFVSDYLK